jgi:hypothetical protein
LLVFGLTSNVLARYAFVESVLRTGHGVPERFFMEGTATGNGVEEPSESVRIEARYNWPGDALNACMRLIGLSGTGLVGVADASMYSGGVA